LKQNGVCEEVIAILEEQEEYKLYNMHFIVQNYQARKYPILYLVSNIALWSFIPCCENLPQGLKWFVISHGKGST